MHTTNYFQTLILVSDDCKRDGPAVPERAGSIAALQFGLLNGAPHAMSSDDLLWRVELARNPDLSDTDENRQAYFSKGRACLRTSPLVKSYGWGIHSDGEGRVALVGGGSPEYLALVADGDVKKVPGIRSSRKK